MAFSLNQRAIPSTDVLFQEVGGEAVLLDLASENYFGLNRVGTRLWQLLAYDGSLQHAFDALLREFDVDPERLAEDMLAIVVELAEARLVRVD